ncbi:MAG: 1-acyl-sn-glycerol-3-phosphate acyltransferase [Oscillospiraceae bacterium]|jgi:1-acyl-sn-glycerol-3-phosphate acyltransferase|nr:1-acyl-sn-glycerol-3-phosphate acyltransferase [Oscillospiraceae bacterium]
MTKFYLFIYSIAAPVIRLLFPHRAVGLENLPEGGALLCANHVSGWDPIIVAIALPKNSRLTVMAKDSLFRIPGLGFILRKLGIFPVKRGGNDLTAMKTAMKVLNGGNRLLVFPEGTRVEEQGEVEAKGGVTVMATRTGVPVIPVYCGERHKFLRKTSVVFGEPYIPVIAGRRPTPEENRKIADEILKRIYDLKEVDGWK